ncbi:hypothetical protein A4H97_33380 [Niastella yeongjuensis]|uniref:Uncharacterized protein n=2 Tax=Niastella yeongjuensis TaxID=354355 RepID=A0A1V9EDN8_9BACT|nr:hypothetical protein A4H97_33380 [Niastella yeongjuensis]
MSGPDTHILKKKQERVSLLLKEITSYIDISILDVVLYCGYKEKQLSSFSKCAKYNYFPKFLTSKIDTVGEKLEQVAKNPDLIRAFKESKEENEKWGFENPSKSFLVWIPLDLAIPVADYRGTNSPLSFTQIGERKGIVAFRNSSKHEADGEIYIDHIGMATDLEPGSRIAIKRINKIDWQTDRYYLIIDISDQVSIRELLPGDDNETIKYVSTRNPDGPHMELLLDRIVAIFSLVDGNCIPRPKRNNTIASTDIDNLLCRK